MLCVYDLGIIGKIVYTHNINELFRTVLRSTYNFPRRFRERHDNNNKKKKKCESKSKQAPLQLVLRRRRPPRHYGAALGRPARSDTDGMDPRLPRLPRRKLRGAGAAEEHTNKEEGCENNIEHAALCVQSCSPPHEQVLKIQPRHLCVVFTTVIYLFLCVCVFFQFLWVHFFVVVAVWKRENALGR